MSLKFVVIGMAMVAAMGLLVIAGLQGEGFMYYVTVTEYLEEGASSDGFRVNGKVVEGSILRDPSGEDVEFLMTDGTRSMPVRYHGIIPDTFVDNADVVVRGGLAEGEVFVADELLAKCPSKYEAADGYEGEGYGGEGYGGEGYGGDSPPESETTPAPTVGQETARLRS